MPHTPEERRAYRLANLEQVRAYERANYRKNKENKRATSRAWFAKHPEYRRKHLRDYGLRQKYGIGYDEKEQMLEAQDRRCANGGCRTDDPGSIRGWHVDHCHKTGKVRGILCHHCNVALGQAKDCAVRLQGLIDYLQK